MYGTRFRRRGVLRPETTPGGRSRRRLLMRPAAYAILAAVVCVAAATLPSAGKSDQARAAQAPVGNGFTVTPSDMAFILKQIKIAERHSRSIRNLEPTQKPNPDPINDPEYCASLLPGPLTTPATPGVYPDQVPDYLTTYGLRTVDGGCNNLSPSALLNPDGSPATNPNGTTTPRPILKYQTARADQQFPRLADPVFRDAEPITPALPVGPPGP